MRKQMYTRALVTRRQFLKVGAMAGAGVFIASRFKASPLFAAIPGGTLDPVVIPKYEQSLVIPPAMPITATNGGVDYYEIAVRQFRQQILPAGLPMTTVWSYGSINHPGTFNYPAFTIEADFNRPVRVKWINGLVDASGNFLPHLLPVDPTLHWANPPGGINGRDTHPTFTSTPGPYLGPVPIVTHLHGGHTTQESDGYAEAWYLPAANNIDADFATKGSFYEAFKQEFFDRHGVTWDAGSATFQYANDQRASTLWYHDHTLGMTRLNVYAGPAGFYLMRGGPDDLPQGVLPGPAPELSDPPGRSSTKSLLRSRTARSTRTDPFSIPLAASFLTASRALIFPAATSHRFLTLSSSATRLWSMARTWPKLEVEPRRYRFRFLNGCNSRFLILKMVIRSDREKARNTGFALLANWFGRRLPA